LRISPAAGQSAGNVKAYEDQLITNQILRQSFSGEIFEDCYVILSPDLPVAEPVPVEFPFKASRFLGAHPIVLS